MLPNTPDWRDAEARSRVVGFIMDALPADIRRKVAAEIVRQRDGFRPGAAPADVSAYWLPMWEQAVTYWNQLCENHAPPMPAPKRTRTRTQSRTTPTCVFCQRSHGVQFAMFNPRFKPFGTACVECEATLPPDTKLPEVAA